MKEQYKILKEGIRIYSKTTLACQYNPYVQPASARKVFNSWIRRNHILKEELEQAGYDKKGILLTPAQVAIIFKHLGEP